MEHQPVDPGLDVGGCPVFICQHLGHSGNLKNWDNLNFQWKKKDSNLHMLGPQVGWWVRSWRCHCLNITIYNSSENINQRQIHRRTKNRKYYDQITSCSLQRLDQFLDFPDFDILISVLCIFTHFEGVVGAGGVVTEVDKPPLTSQALKLKINP